MFNTNFTRMANEELVEEYARMTGIVHAYEELSLDVPEFTKSYVTALKKEIGGRQRDEMERKLRTLTARREAIKPLDEKRKDIDSEIETLKAKLA